MKRHDYRPSYSGRKNADGRLPASRIIIIIALCALLGWILYKGKAFSPENPEQPEPTDTPIVKIPSATVNFDGISYEIPGMEGAENTAVDWDDIKVIGMGKDSEARFSFEKQPDFINITLYKDHKMVLSSQNPVIMAEDLPGEGRYRGICDASWSVGNFKGTAYYHFDIEADFPPYPRASAQEIDPGELLVITVDNMDSEEALDIETDLDFVPNVFQYENRRIILLPVSYYNEQGKVYQVKLLMGDEDYSYAIKVREKEFITQYMTIDPKIATETRNDKSAQEVKEKVDPLRPVCDEEPYWTGNFIMPVEGGRVTETDFGKKRYVNNAPTSYRHNGLDIGHDAGVPVMASNTGRVLLADYLIGTGNTVIIEHGFGLKTWYYHMNELTVKTGDMVTKGDIIGKVGSTGFSTGPHLHFSASVNNVYINPITLINEGVPLVERE